VIAGERVQGRPVLVSREGWAVSPLKRVAFEDRRVQEGWLQELLRRHPELLPSHWGLFELLVQATGTRRAAAD